MLDANQRLWTKVNVRPPRFPSIPWGMECITVRPRFMMCRPVPKFWTVLFRKVRFFNTTCLKDLLREPASVGERLLFSRVRAPISRGCRGDIGGYAGRFR